MGIYLFKIDYKMLDKKLSEKEIDFLFRKFYEVEDILFGVSKEDLKNLSKEEKEEYKDLIEIIEEAIGDNDAITIAIG